MDWLRDYALVRYLRKRVWHYLWETHICRRKSDGTLWAASSPQCMGSAMAGLFNRDAPQFHFVKVREWRGLLVVSPKIIWLPRSGEFDLLYDCKAMWLKPWYAPVENVRVERLAKEYKAQAA